MIYKKNNLNCLIVTSMLLQVYPVSAYCDENFVGGMEAEIEQLEAKPEESPTEEAPAGDDEATKGLNEEEKAELVKQEIERKKEEARFKALAPSGVIASIGGGVGSQSVGTLGNVPIGKTSEPPLTATVSKTKSNWQIVFSNSSKKHITANIKVEQFGHSQKGAAIKSDHLSISLAGGAQATRNVTFGTMPESVQVKITNWKAS
jgi:hypothetical protein